MKFLNLYNIFAFYIFIVNLFHSVENYGVIFKQLTLSSFPEVLPKYSSMVGNFTQFEQFKIIMLNMNLTRYEAKEV
jgi:hypothetical protein